MEFIETHILNFFVMEVEISQRTYLIVLLFAADIPDGEFTIITSSNDLSLLDKVPLKRVALSLMP